MTAVRTRSIRHELEYFFAKGHPFDGKLAHTPILVLQVLDDEVECFVTRHPEDLLPLADDVRCIQSWPGQYRSDMFTYTVGEARAEIVAALRRRSPRG